MDNHIEEIIKRIVRSIREEGPIQIKHIHKNSFGLVIEYYSLDYGRNYTLSLNDILMVIEEGKRGFEQ